jgi:hypothetical protein
MMSRRTPQVIHSENRNLVDIPPATRWYLARLISGPEDGGDTFLRNICSHTDYTALYPKRGQHSRSFLAFSFREYRSAGVMTTSVVEWSEFLAADPEVRVRFPALPDFLRSSESGTGSTQTREYN